MKYLKTYEGFWGNLARLSPERKENDEKAVQLFHDISNDFEKYGSDLKKIKIVDRGGTNISLNNLTIGKNYTINYVFGKYHPIKRDVFSSNIEHGDRRVIIDNIPFFIVLKKNELEKAFNTSRIKLTNVTVNDIKNFENLDGTQKQRFNEKVDKYNISSDIANQLFDYFIEEFNIQYPDLKSSKYKNSMSIKNIEKGIKPIIKHIEVKGKDGRLLTFDLRLGDNEQEIRKMLSNMTESEYDVFWKKRRKELHEPSDKKEEEYKKEICGKISEILKNCDINLEPVKFNEFGFGRATVNEYEIVVEFTSNDPEIEFKLHNAIKIMQNIDGYEFKSKRIMDGYSDKNMKFIILHFEKK